MVFNLSVTTSATTIDLDTLITTHTHRHTHICALTSGYLDLQGGADEGHEGGGKVDGHVLVHRHVHQDESLMAAERVSS